MRRNSVPRRTASGAALHDFPRTPGVPSISVHRLTADSTLPTGRPHAHDFLVLLYAHRAHGTVLIDDRRWTVTDGDVLLIGPGQVVSLPDRSEMFGIRSAWSVAFPADVVRPGAGSAYSSWRAHPLLLPFAHKAGRAQRLHVPENERRAWLDRIRTLDAELRTRRDGSTEAAHAHLTLLLVAVSRLSTDLAGELRRADEPLLAAVFDVIERRFHEPISLADVAAELALTPGHLTTVVRRRTGRTVQQWLAERRMQQARVLLAESGLTVAAVSHRVGYPDVSYFIKRFRAAHAMTPVRWRAAAGVSPSSPASARPR